MDDLSNFGFVLVHEGSCDHRLARYLKTQGALHTYRKMGTSTVWDRPDGNPAAFAMFDNAASTYRLFVLECYLPLWAKSAKA